MKQAIKKVVGTYNHKFEDNDMENFDEDSFPIHYSNQTYSSSPRSRKFKVNRNKFSSEAFLGLRKKSKLMN